MSNEFWEQVNLAKLATLTKKNFGFIGSMLYKLKIEPTDTVKHMYLDGINSTIKVNPDWFTSLSPEQSASMLAHEVLHYSLQHDIRRGNKEPQHYQKACDEVVNNMLMDFGFTLPDDINVNRRYQNQDTERVYKQILEEYGDNQPDNDNSGGNDIPQSQPDLSNAQQNQRNRQVGEADVANKASGSKSIGDSSEAFEQLFKDISTGKLNWKQLLSDHFNELTAGEPSFHDLDRRMLSLGFFEPINESVESVRRVALALDVSGSITENQIQIFLQEIKAIAETLNPETISIMTFNTDVVDVFEFKQDEDFTDIKIRISGGTNFDCIFKHYNKPENSPEFLIVFSDLEVYNYPNKPKYDTTWLCFDNLNLTAPFGRTIHVNSEDL